MEVLYARCAGLDVHKKTVVACCLETLPNGQTRRETRTFGTTTPALLTLLDHLQARGCSIVAMESTGEYWKPIYNLFEGALEILLVNARHIKTVPGRKTDVKDAEWIADLLRHGLLQASFVPPQPQRDLRALTRQRISLVEERASVVNRLQKVLEDANVKLSSVATDVIGASGRAMLEALIAGETDAQVLAELAKGRLRNKRDALVEALTGRVRAPHGFLLAAHLKHLDFLADQIEHFDREIARHLEQMTEPTGASEEPTVSPQSALQEETASPSDASPPDASPSDASPPDASPRRSYAEAVEWLDPIPGIDQRAAQAILAEIGMDMSRFPSAGHLASWAGVAPGNYQSAGKSYSGKTRPGNPGLRKALVQATHGAIRTKGSSFGALYHRIAARRGKKRALVAVAHALLRVIYHVLRDRKPYQELGADYLDRSQKDKTVNRLVSRLTRLGYQVRLDPQTAPLAA